MYELSEACGNSVHPNSARKCTRPVCHSQKKSHSSMFFMEQHQPCYSRRKKSREKEAAKKFPAPRSVFKTDNLYLGRENGKLGYLASSLLAATMANGRERETRDGRSRIGRSDTFSGAIAKIRPEVTIDTPCTRDDRANVSRPRT